MTSTAPEHPGIMSWVSAIRTSMVNDPGRQILEDQIQGNGFLFLEDYLDGILTGPRHDPIIELVKTPGRKKDVSKKTRAATAAANKARNIVTVTLDKEDFNKENEGLDVNSAPINAFHKALLQSKGANSGSFEGHSSNDSRPPDTSLRSTKSSSKKFASKAKAVTITEPKPESKRGPIDDRRETEEEAVVEKLVTPPRTKSHTSEAFEMEPPPFMPSVSRDNETLAPAHTESNKELSVIAEDDESAERSRVSINSSQVPNAPVEDKHLSSKPSGKISKSSYRVPLNIEVMDIDDLTQTTVFTASSSTSSQSFQTVPLDSPTSTTIVPKAPLSEPPVVSVPLSEQKTDLVPLEHLADADLIQKPVAPHFPTIGAPSPLRKSMRIHREPSVAGMHAPPAAKPLATRSSWLVKAREAKAIEENAKKTSTLIVLPSSISHAAIGNKRKSGEMLDINFKDTSEHDEGRTQKMSKIIETSPMPPMPKEQERHPFTRLQNTVEMIKDDVDDISDSEMHDDGLLTGDGSEGIIDKLKKTVAGFSARAGKSMGKSLGGATANALAEARAAAEARIAERNAAEGRIVPSPVLAPAQLVLPETEEAKVPTPVFVPPPPKKEDHVDSRDPTESDRRLSVSDLVTKYETKKSVEKQRVFQPPPPAQPKDSSSSGGLDIIAADTSTSTTPPNSPPPARPPIFTLPEKSKAQVIPTFFPPSSQTFSRLELPPFAPSCASQPLSVQSTFFSTQSTYADTIFDNEIPAWVPSTQDTDLSDFGPSQQEHANGLNRNFTEPETDAEEDESWHLDEKFGETWSPVVMGMKDDSMTWSTAPTRSTRGGDTGGLDISMPPPSIKKGATQELNEDKTSITKVLPSETGYATDEDMDVDECDKDIAGIRLVTPVPQSESNLLSSNKVQQGESGNSSNSSFSHGGFFSSATKLVSSVLGGSKKGKEPVKSIQLAAAAAKKQQEEVEKKATRLKEMEARRQQVLQKKAEEEKALEEKKAKDANDRWKRDKEKEDTTEKRALRQPGKKLTQIEDDLTKKKKPAEPEKKIESKKPPSKEKKDAPSKIGKFVPNSSQSITNASTSKSTKQTASSLAQSMSVKVFEAKLNPALKGKGKAKEGDIEDKQPAQVVQTQMHARTQSQIEDVRKVEMPPPAVPSESIELPDINSEYSDSDDEDRVRTFDRPHWAQSPELREALQSQSSFNPDDIFGAIKPLKMEELFKTRTSRFRARTSSANWAGTDELTAAEEKEYARRMGYSK